MQTSAGTNSPSPPPLTHHQSSHTQFQHIHASISVYQYSCRNDHFLRLPRTRQRPTLQQLRLLLLLCRKLNLRLHQSVPRWKCLEPQPRRRQRYKSKSKQDLAATFCARNVNTSYSTPFAIKLVMHVVGERKVWRFRFQNKARCGFTRVHFASENRATGVVLTS